MMFAAIEAIEDAGDRAFLLSLYQEYHLLMFTTARKYLSSQADCEDVVQSSLEQLIKHVDTLRELPQLRGDLLHHSHRPEHGIQLAGRRGQTQQPVCPSGGVPGGGRRPGPSPPTR